MKRASHEQTPVPQQAARLTGPQRARRAFFRVLLLALVLSPLVLLEVSLRVFAPAPVVGTDDPYVSFARLKPLFVLDETGARYGTAASRLQFFRPQSFPARKAADTQRIFVLGGSTVQGRPWSVETAFSTWLKLALDAAEPKTGHEVINCGGISYASYRLLPIMREVLPYRPDLFIVCTGHNEFLEDRTYAPLKRLPRWGVRLHSALRYLRAYRLADDYLSRRGTPPHASTLPAEVRARLDFAQGLESYHRDDAWRVGVIEHFEHNLRAMARLAKEAGVPLIFVRPPANIKDCPPFKSEFDAGLPEAERARARALLEHARSVPWNDIAQKLALLSETARIDPRHAETCWLLGKCDELTSRTGDTRQWFMRAKEEDVCPLRMLEPMAHAMEKTARRHGIPLVDADRLLTERTDDGILGDEWLVDHVHPRIAAHQLIASALVDTMTDMGLLHPRRGWQAERDQLWQQHLASLNEAYFEQGQHRLKRVTEWARGRIPQGGALSDQTDDGPAAE